MNSLLKLKGFLSIYSIFLLGGILLIALFDHEELHLLLSSWNNPSFDKFFYFITYFGDGRLFFFFPLLLLITSIRKFFFIFLGSAISAISTQILKRIIELPRPSAIFETSQLYIVEGVKMHKHFSFPSGHATTVFAFFFCLAILKPKLSWLFALLAILAAYSRVYLSQHFLEDIIAGSIVGITGASISLLIVRRISEKWDRNLFGFADKL